MKICEEHNQLNPVKVSLNPQQYKITISFNNQLDKNLNNLKKTKLFTDSVMSSG